MAQQQAECSPLNELCSALPSLPMRLAAMSQYFVEKG
jgi:hypothetical protein